MHPLTAGKAYLDWLHLRTIRLKRQGILLASQRRKSTPTDTKVTLAGALAASASVLRRLRQLAGLTTLTSLVTPY